MSELTPEQISAQDQARENLRKLRRESETWFSRRDEAIVAADKTGLSLRDIGREVGMSAQGVLNILNRLKD